MANLTAVYLGGKRYIIRGTTSVGTSVASQVVKAEPPADGNFQVQISALPAMRK